MFHLLTWCQVTASGNCLWFSWSPEGHDDLSFQYQDSRIVSSPDSFVLVLWAPHRTPDLDPEEWSYESTVINPPGKSSLVTVDVADLELQISFLSWFASSECKRLKFSRKCLCGPAGDWSQGMPVRFADLSRLSGFNIPLVATTTPPLAAYATVCIWVWNT
jgi:hypothetical protein